MRYSRYLFFTFYFCLFIFYSCKDDPVTPSAPSETLIYSFDSLSVWSSDSGNINIDNYFEKHLNTEPNDTKVEFDLETNIDSLAAEFNAQIYVCDTAVTEWFLSKQFQYPYEFNKFYSFTVKTVLFYPIIEVRCYIIIDDSYNHLLKFVRIRNFKVYKVS